MKRYILVALLVAAIGACKEPATFTARPDPATSTDGTIGSVKATDGTVPPAGNGLPGGRDTTRRN